MKHTSLAEFPDHTISVDGIVTNTRTGKVLTPVKVKVGYLKFTLSHQKGGQKYLHRLLMETFGPAKPTPRALVRHLNDIKTDNRLENLAWGTHRDNARDARRNNRMALGIDHPVSKLSPEKIDQARTLSSSGVSQSEIGKMFGVHQTTIFYALHGITWNPAADGGQRDRKKDRRVARNGETTRVSTVVIQKCQPDMPPSEIVFQVVEKHGEPGGTRTHDPMIKS